jgi:hypothetical protein
MLADAVELDEEAWHAAWREQLTSAGAWDDPAVRVGFIRWQVLRAGTPLRLIAQNPETGPIPVATAHAADGLHVLLGVIGSSYQAVAVGDVETLAARAGLLRSAQEALQNPAPPAGYHAHSVERPRAGRMSGNRACSTNVSSSFEIPSPRPRRAPPLLSTTPLCPALWKRFDTLSKREEICGQVLLSQFSPCVLPGLARAMATVDTGGGTHARRCLGRRATRSGCRWSWSFRSG